MQYIDPDLFRDLFIRIGDLYVELWSKMIQEYSDIFIFFRMGDDLGHRTSTMLEPTTIINHILPQTKRIIDLVHHAEKKFLLHSCGNIFEIMPDIITLGIDAKHSNEDQIAPFDEWIKRYNGQIGLFGGFDVNLLSLGTYQSVYDEVLRKGTEYRRICKGYGLPSNKFEEKKNNKKDLSISRAIIPVPPTQNFNSSQQDKSRKYLKHAFSKL